MKQQRNVLDFLQLYLTDKMFGLVVIETNRFANKFFLGNLDNKAANSYLKNWTGLTVNELQVFIGLVILMGIVHKPNINSYWSRNELYNTPIFLKVMPRDRFKVILRFLHFNDNATYNVENADRDHLHKVRPLRVHFRQYIKT